MRLRYRARKKVLSLKSLSLKIKLRLLVWEVSVTSNASECLSKKKTPSYLLKKVRLSKKLYPFRRIKSKQNHKNDILVFILLKHNVYLFSKSRYSRFDDQLDNNFDCTCSRGLFAI
jgi:hypothetical protein